MPCTHLSEWHQRHSRLVSCSGVDRARGAALPRDQRHANQLYPFNESRSSLLAFEPLTQMLANRPAVRVGTPLPLDRVIRRHAADIVNGTAVEFVAGSPVRNEDDVVAVVSNIERQFALQNEVRFSPHCRHCLS